MKNILPDSINEAIDDFEGSLREQWKSGTTIALVALIPNAAPIAFWTADPIAVALALGLPVDTEIKELIGEFEEALHEYEYAPNVKKTEAAKNRLSKSREGLAMFLQLSIECAKPSAIEDHNLLTIGPGGNVRGDESDLI